MSGPKDYTYTPPPPPPPPVYYTHHHSVGSHEEATETLAVIGKMSGVSIRVVNGEIVTTYSDTSGWSYSELSRIIAKAKEQAIKNLAYVRQVKETNLRAIDAIVVKEKEAFDENIKNLDLNIAKLEALKKKISAPLVTPSVTITCDKEVAEVEKEIERLKKEKEELIKEHRDVTTQIERYRHSMMKVVTTADLNAAESIRPAVSTAIFDHSIETDDLSERINEGFEVITAFVDTVNKLYDFMDKENMGEYKIRLDDKVKALDPRNPESLKALDKLINEIIQERKFKLSDEAGQKLAKDNQELVAKQLDVLRNISQSLKSIVFKVDSANHEIADISEANKEIIKTVDDLMSNITSLDYISPSNKNLLISLKHRIESLKRVNLNNPKVTIELDRIAIEAARLVDEAIKENQKYDEYMKAMEEYLKVRNQLLGLSEDGQDIVDLSKHTFNMAIADKLIEDLKKDTEEMKQIVQEIMGRSLVGSMATAVGNESVFMKEEVDGKATFSFVRKENPGVLFMVEQTDAGATITPRGVVLSNGIPVIDEEGLRAVHSSCEWSDEMNDKLVEAGMPAFTAKEKGKEATEALYDIDNYYHIEDDEASIRYLRLCGYSDEEIESVFHYDVRTGTRKEATSDKHTVDKAIEKNLDKD